MTTPPIWKDTPIAELVAELRKHPMGRLGHAVGVTHVTACHLFGVDIDDPNPPDAMCQFAPHYLRGILLADTPDGDAAQAEAEAILAAWRGRAN